MLMKQQLTFSCSNYLFTELVFSKVLAYSSIAFRHINEISQDKNKQFRQGTFQEARQRGLMRMTRPLDEKCTWCSLPRAMQLRAANAIKDTHMRFYRKPPHAAGRTAPFIQRPCL